MPKRKPITNLGEILSTRVVLRSRIRDLSQRVHDATKILPGSRRLLCLTTEQNGAIIDRLTYAAACELFILPSEVSLLATLKPGAISDEVIGLLLEHQVLALEPYLRKDGMQAFMRGLLRDTSQCVRPLCFRSERLECS
jgi:hypothetical protein